MKPDDSLGLEPPMNNDGDSVSRQRERIEAEIQHSGASTIGLFLRYKRQEKALTLDEIDLITHIGPRWTEAIEEGTWSLYPSLLYAKGHIRGYCEALDIPGDILLDLFSKELMTAFPEEIFHPHPVLQVNQILQDPSSGAGRSSPSGGGRMVLWLLLGAFALLLLLGGVKVWMDKAEKRHVRETSRPLSDLSHSSASRKPVQVAPPSTSPSTVAPPVTTLSQGASPQQQGTSSQGVTSSQPQQTPSAVQESPSLNTVQPSQPSSGTAPSISQTAPTTPVTAPSAPSSSAPSPDTKPASGLASQASAQEKKATLHRLRVVATRDTWIAVKEGGDRARRYSLSEGQSKVFRSRESFQISTKDGGAILLSLDGKSLGTAGADHKPVRHKTIVP